MRADDEAHVRAKRVESWRQALGGATAELGEQPQR